MKPLLTLLILSTIILTTLVTATVSAVMNSDVISNISDINILLRRIDNFLDDVKNIAADKHYPYSVATGYGIIDDSGIDQCFKVVDSKMYQNKRASKKGRLN